MAERVTILELMDLLAGWFKGASWDAWRACLAALFGLPMSEADLATYRRFTGRTQAPEAPAREGWILVGRRGGKSLIAALVALWAAVFRSYAGILAPGEAGVVMIIASDKAQARIIYRYLGAYFDRIPGLAALVVGRTQDTLTLSNQIRIEVRWGSYRSVRGPTVVAFIGDEVAFWNSDTSAIPAAETLHAIRPAQATVPAAVRLLISSPYARRDVVWTTYTKHYGQEGDPILVWAADARSMNPTIPPEVIEEAFEADEAVAWSEYGRDGVIRFRQDVESFIAKEVLEAVTVLGRRRLPPISTEHYVAFCDPAGGSGQDSFTLAIAHAEERDGRLVAVLDLVEERRPPFSPEATAQEFAGILAAYRIPQVGGDKYAGDWPGEQFRKHGISYEPSEKPKSDIYRDCLPLLTSGMVELLDVPRLVAQLGGLERRTARGGRDSIDHGPGGHDDLINSAAGALVACAQGSTALLWFMNSPMGAPAPAPVAARPPSIDRMIRDDAISEELRRQRGEDAQAAFVAKRQAEGLAAVKAREENAVHLRAEEAAQEAKDRELDAADERRLRRARDPRLWTNWGG